MKVKATVSFAGEISMAVNEVRDVPKDIAAPLLACSYLVEADGEDAAETKHTGENKKPSTKEKEAQ